MLSKLVFVALTCVIALVPGIAPTNAYAGTPCGAILCLGGLLEGRSGGPACATEDNQYFDIRVFDIFGFDPGATAAARGGYLAGCPAPEDAEWAAAVNGTFGPMLDGPAF